MASRTFVGESPPSDWEWGGDCYCARCGCTMDVIDCPDCEDGFSHHDCGDDCCCCLYPEPNVCCETCNGAGFWRRCDSPAEWCNAHPMPGREDVTRSTPEWRESPEPRMQD